MESFIMFFVCFGAAVGYTSNREPAKYSQKESTEYDHRLAASTLASHESFYDDSEENIHTSSDDGSLEYDTDDSPGYSPEKSNPYDNNNNQPKWEGPLAQPPGYDANGAPHPVQDLPAVVAERQKHLHLFSFGPHAGAVAAAHPPYLKPVPGGYSSPWIPIIVPLTHPQHQHLQQPYLYNHLNNYQG